MQVPTYNKFDAGTVPTYNFFLTLYSVFYFACFMFEKVITLLIGDVFIQPIVTKKIKFRIFDDIYLYKKIISAAARMRFIFVTRCAGKKAIFFWA